MPPPLPRTAWQHPPQAHGRRTNQEPPRQEDRGRGGARAYRRMPEDFRTVYEQTTSPSALAEHYGVPRHTAQGWIRRIKAGN